MQRHGGRDINMGTGTCRQGHVDRDMETWIWRQEHGNRDGTGTCGQENVDKNMGTII